MAERAQVSQGVLDAAVVVEDDLADGGYAWKGIPDRHHGHLLGDRLPAAAGRADRQHDQAVDAVVHEPPGQLQLALRLAVGVRDQRAAVCDVELALHRPHQLLVPEVGQAADQQPDDGRGTAAQRACDRVGLVAELFGRSPDALLGLGRHVHASQRVADRGRRQAGLLGQLPDRRATLLSLRHLTPAYPTRRNARTHSAKQASEALHDGSAGRIMAMRLKRFTETFNKRVQIDVHQHLWPEPLVAELARRREAPRLRRRREAWAAEVPGEPDAPVDLADHDPDARAGPAGFERGGPMLGLLAGGGGALFLHPGPAPDTLSARGIGHESTAVPSWWPAATRYVAALNAAWNAFAVFGRPAHPQLRVCFAMLAGLGPLHRERLLARGGQPVADRDVFLDTSSYGARAVDAVIRELGVDALVYG